MTTRTGTSKHRGNCYILPSINLIFNRGDAVFKDNYQVHFNFLHLHFWIVFE